LPRRARIALANVPLHVIQRGNNRQACFFADDDYLFYLDQLKLCAQRAGCAIHAFNKDAARLAAQLRATLESAGKPIGPMDTLIAGTALAVSGVLVTHNTGEFARVKSLRLADWY
jgi:hypothetical protein